MLKTSYFTSEQITMLTLVPLLKQESHSFHHDF